MFSLVSILTLDTVQWENFTVGAPIDQGVAGGTSSIILFVYRIVHTSGSASDAVVLVCQLVVMSAQDALAVILIGV